MTAQDHDQSQHPQVALRSPDVVMRLKRMGSFFPTRLSFMRTTIRWLNESGAQVTRPVWEIDDEGYGRAVYSVEFGGHTYSLAAFSTPLAPEDRTDRVIAEAWDTTYVLFDGVPTAQDLDRLEANAPKQEAGRFEATDLVLCRANKSVRLFEHVVDSLAHGRQPDAKAVGDIGYLMRTTAVYGNGKFGIADRARIAGRPGLQGPFQAEMLTVWLIRGFTHDLVEHIAMARAPETATELDRCLRRDLGIGNSTGLGMAPFLVNHPILLNNWMLVRETALARVRAIECSDAATIEHARHLMERVQQHLDQWNVSDKRQMKRIRKLRKEVRQLAELVTLSWLADHKPWDRLVRASEKWSLECQELVVALVLELHGELVNGLTDCMSSHVEPQLDPVMPVGELRRLLKEHYAWALDIEFGRKKNTKQFWYVSEEKLEPRLGRRRKEPGAELEMPLDIARQAKRLRADLKGVADEQLVAEFVLRHPEHRQIVRRVQTAAGHPYSEIRDNLIGADCLAIDILRCKLSFFGASKFDPKSDRWTRINMYQGAPLFDEVTRPDADDWWLPVME